MDQGQTGNRMAMDRYTLTDDMRVTDGERVLSLGEIVSRLNENAHLREAMRRQCLHLEREDADA